MFDFKETFVWLLTLITEQKEKLFTILIFTMLGAACYFFFEQYTNEKSIGAKDIELLKSAHLEEIKKIREHQIDSEIEFQIAISACKKECRIKIDSIDDYYYHKFRNLHESVMRIDKKVNTLIR